MAAVPAVPAVPAVRPRETRERRLRARLADVGDARTLDEYRKFETVMETVLIAFLIVM